MKALVLIAHGSRRHASNEEVVSLVGSIAEAMKHEYPIVQAGFLELAEPLIPDAIDCCVKRGAMCVVVVPYFLSAGRHVHEDIPAEVDRAREMHADVPIKILPHIGGSELMPDMIRRLVQDAPE